MRIAYVSNSNKLVQEKVNFFVDWFHYCVDNIGKNKNLELENPLSLIEKILFQHANGKLDNRAKYISHYLSHEFFKHDEYLIEFDSYVKAKPFIDAFNRSSEKIKKNLIESTNPLWEKLLAVKLQLQNEMFRTSLSALTSYFNCAHNVAKHKEEIKFHTQILITEYLFNDRDRNDLNSVFTKIMSKEIQEYPFPSEVKTKHQKLSHLAQSDLKQQFDGLLNLLHIPPKTTKYIFKLFGTSFDPGMFFKYNEVTFYSRDHKKFASVRKNIAERPFGNDFFNDSQNYILASVPVKMHSEDAAVVAARKIVETEMRYLSWKLDRGLLIDTTTNYLFTSNDKTYGWHLSTDSYHKSFRSDIIRHLNDNPFNHLRRINNEVKNRLLAYEPLYINAIKTHSIADMWHYLETLLNTNKGEAKGVQRQVSTIVLNNEEQLYKSSIRSTLYYALSPFNIHPEYFNLDFSDLQAACVQLRKGRISPKLRQIKYPFIQELVKAHNKKLSPLHFKEAKEFYNSILFETQEYRNFYIHMATTNKKAQIKLTSGLFQIVRRLRWALFSESKKNSSLSFRDIIELMIAKGESLTQ